MSLRSDVQALGRASEALSVAIRALEAISDDRQTSLRHRDPNCTRYVASDALDEIERKTGRTLAGVRWNRGTKVSGDVYPESERR